MGNEKERRTELIKQVIQARTEKGLTQTQLGELIDELQPHIARMESGEHNVTLDFLLKVSDALDKEVKLVQKYKKEFVR